MSYWYCLSGYANSGSLYHAGKQLDMAMLVCKEQNDLSEVGKENIQRNQQKIKVRKVTLVLGPAFLIFCGPMFRSIRAPPLLKTIVEDRKNTSVQGSVSGRLFRIVGDRIRILFFGVAQKYVPYLYSC